MCDVCGCGDSNLVPIALQHSLMARNDHQAAHLREHFQAAGVLAINLMGSPGSGKTALLEATAKQAAGMVLRAVSGDLATSNDADRLSAAGIESRPITTGTACHLDADMVHHALHHMPWRECDWFFIENVGNLVCPAIYDLGQAANVVVLSVTEGEDKPLKYPVIFREADLVVISKTDLLAVLDFDLAALIDNLGRVMPDPQVLQVSARTGEGVADWVAWLRAQQAGLAHSPGHADHHAHP